MPTIAEILNQERAAEAAAAEAMGLTRQLTLREFLDRRPAGVDRQPVGPVFIFARGRMQRVGYIRWPCSDPWAVCPEENGGFGLSYAVHFGTVLWTA